MSKTDDFKGEFPLLYQRLVDSNTPGLVFLAGTLRGRINEVMEPLGFPKVLARDPPDQTLSSIEQFLEARS